MNKRNLTANQIHELGIEALMSKLGTAGMIRFFHQHKMGKGNYSIDRHQWLTVPDVETLANQIQGAGKAADTETKNNSEEIAATGSREILNLTLNFAEDSKTEAPIGFLGKMLGKLQDVVNTIRMVHIKSDQLTEDIKDEMGISLLDVGAGSFEIQLASTKSVDLFNDSNFGNAFGNAIEVFMELLNAGSDQNQLKKLLEQLKSKVAKDYTEFLRSLNGFVIDTRFKWTSPNPNRGRTVSLSNPQIREAIEILKRFQEESPKTFRIEGTLIGGSLKSKRFEIKSTKDKIYTGKIADQVLETVSKPILNQAYAAKIQEISKRSETTDEITKTEYQLLSLKIIDGPQN